LHFSQLLIFVEQGTQAAPSRMYPSLHLHVPVAASRVELTAHVRHEGCVPLNEQEVHRWI